MIIFKPFHHSDNCAIHKTRECNCVLNHLRPELRPAVLEFQPAKNCAYCGGESKTYDAQQSYTSPVERNAYCTNNECAFCSKAMTLADWNRRPGEDAAFNAALTDMIPKLWSLTSAVQYPNIADKFGGLYRTLRPGHAAIRAVNLYDVIALAEDMRR